MIRELWNEWGTLYPSFEFLHGLGLSVLCVGQTVSQPVLELCSLPSPDDIATVRTRFAAFGERWRVEARQNELYRELATRNSRIAALERAESMEVNAVTAEAAAEIQRMAAIVKAAYDARIATEEHAHQAMLQRDQVLSSITWRAARPLHCLLAHVPGSVSRPVRALLNAGMSFLTSVSRRHARRADGESDVAKSPGSANLADSLDLYDDRAVQAVVGPPREWVLWSPQRPDAVFLESLHLSSSRHPRNGIHVTTRSSDLDASLYSPCSGSQFLKFKRVYVHGRRIGRWIIHLAPFPQNQFIVMPLCMICTGVPSGRDCTCPAAMTRRNPSISRHLIASSISAYVRTTTP